LLEQPVQAFEMPKPDDLDRELQNHLDLEAEELRAQGLSAPEARRLAHLTLGNQTAIKETVFEMNPVHTVDSLGRDIQQALRVIRLNPRYSTTLIAILAVCLGANMAVFSIVYSVLLRPLPVPEADQIVLMANRYPKAGAGESGQSAAGDYYDRMRAVTAIQDHAMYDFAFQVLEGEPASERIRGMAATPSLFRLLRISPKMGRTFAEAEGEPGHLEVVVLSHSLWRGRYGADPSIVGRQIRMGGRPFTVIGVMPEDFLFVDPEVRFWTPLVFNAEEKQAHHNNNWYNIGRLRSGSTIEQVQAQVNAVNAANLETAGPLRELLVNTGFETRVTPLKEYLIRDARSAIEMLWLGAILVLLIGALNVAGLVVARTTSRRREIGTRLALGASFKRLGAQVVVENLVLSLLAGVGGLAVAYVTISALTIARLNQFPRAAEVRVDAVTVVFGLAAAVTAGLVVAAFSLSHISRLGIGSALADFSRTSTAGRRSGYVRKGLVIAQVGFAFVLLMGSAIVLASFRELLRVQPGFDIDGILTASTLAPSSRYAKPADLESVMERSLAEVRSIPGVTQAGATSAIPLQATFNDSVILPEGYTARAGESVISPLHIVATPGYFEAMGIRLVAGRYFDKRETAASQKVVIIDQQLASRFWPGQNAVGRRMHQPSEPDLKTGPATAWLTVIGVVNSIRMKTLAGAPNEAGAYYFPAAQSPIRTFTLAIRTQGHPESVISSVRAAMQRVDPLLALYEVQSMNQRVDASLASRRAALTLSMAFGAVSLLLASIGLYGVLSYLFMQRRREIAVRMAIGCTPAQAFSLFVREGSLLAGTGIVLGALAAFLGRDIAEKFAYGVKPFDPPVVGMVLVTLLVVTLLATALPARQAARVDPASALAGL
jgi:predicted permease